MSPCLISANWLTLLELQGTDICLFSKIPTNIVFYQMLMFSFVAFVLVFFEKSSLDVEWWHLKRKPTQMRTHFLLPPGQRACACVYLVLLPSAFLVVVEHVLSDILPLAVMRGHMVHALLQPLVPPPAGVQKQAQHQHWGVPKSMLAQRKHFHIIKTRFWAERHIFGCKLNWQHERKVMIQHHARKHCSSVAIWKCSVQFSSNAIWHPTSP